MVVENFRPDVKRRLGIDYEDAAQDQPADRLCQHLRLRPDRPLCRSAGLRPDRPGHGRADVGHRIAGPGAGARRHPGRRPDGRAVLRARHPDRAAGAREVGEGQWVQTSLLQAQIFMLDFQAARWLIDKEVPRAGRQQPSDRDPDRRVQDRRTATSISPPPARRSGSASARRSAPRRCCEHPDYATGAGALEEPRRAQCRNRNLHREQHQRGLDRDA